MVGLPRAGKSTAALDRETAAIVSPDAIRLALHGQRFQAEAEPFVWAIARTMVRSLFLAGHCEVVVDATNVTQRRRDEWVREAAALQAEYVPVIVETAPAECIRRARAEGDMEIIPVIERMEREWDLPRPASWGVRS
jgi:predicted kinase